MILSLFIILVLPQYSYGVAAQSIQAGNWSARLTWAIFKTGTITSPTGSSVVQLKTIEGVGTLFLTEFQVGDRVYTNNTTASAQAIGTITSIESNTSLTLLASAAFSVTGATYRGSGVPASGDDITIGFTGMATSMTTTLDITTSCNFLTLDRPGSNGTNYLAINTGRTLTNATTIDVQQPQNTGTNEIDVYGVLNTGTITLRGAKSGNTPDKIAALSIMDGGIVNVTGDIMTSELASSKVLAVGTGTLNITGQIQGNSSVTYFTTSTISFAATSILNMTGTTNAQSLVITPSATYGNVYFNNTSAGGATITGAITATNVLGNLIVQSGTFATQGSLQLANFIPNVNGTGLTVTGNALKMLKVDNGATMFVYTTFPTGFGTVNLQPTSTVNYNHPSANQTIAPHNYGNLTVNAGAAARTITLSSTGTIGVFTNFTPASLNNTYTITGSTVAYNGTLAQTMPANFPTYTNLTINNAAGVSLAADVTYNTVLTFTSGVVRTGAFSLIAPSTASVTRTSGHVFGNFKKWTPSTATVTFQIGTSTDYTPMNVTFSSVTTAGFVTGKSTAGDHPSINTASCLISSKSVNVYYTLTNNNATVGNFTIGFGYLASNVDGAATAANLKAKIYSAGAWSAALTNSATPTTTLTTVSGVSVFGEYQIAEVGLNITQPASVSICNGNNASFIVATNGANPTYQWQENSAGTWGNISNGGVYSNATTTTLNLTSASTTMNGYQYRCQITTTASADCPAATTPSDAATLTVNTAPTPIAGTAVITCSTTGAVNITAGSSANNSASITWTSSGTGSFASATSLTTATYTPSSADISAGSVTLTLTATGIGSCPSATSTKTLTISAPVAQTISGSSTVCISSPSTYTSTTSGGTWSSGTTTVATVNASTGAVTGVAAGSSVISYSVTTTGGCVNTATKTATVIVCTYSWTGATSTNWTLASNWNPSIVPTSSDSVRIPSGMPFMPTVSSSVNAARVTINSGATLTLLSTGTLNAYGNIINNGTFTAVSGSSVSFNGNTAQTVTGVQTLYNVQLTNTSGGVSLLSAVTVNGSITLTSGVLTTNSNLTVNFDTGGNIAYNVTDAGSISGNVTGRRDVTARTHYITAPFSGATSAQVQATTPLFVNSYWKMYTKTFATQGWAAVTDVTTAMDLGTGFSLAYPNASSLKLTGTYNHNFSFTSPSYSNADAGKYILVGNPYPSTIDWSAIYNGGSAVNTGGAIYYWNAANNQVASWISATGGTNGGTQHIPAMQSFMVATTGAGGPTSSVAINNTARVLNNSAYFRTTQSGNSILRLAVQTVDGVVDETLISLNNDATEEFEFDKDAYKIINSGFTPSLYTSTHAGPTMYSINSLPFDEEQSIPLHLKVTKNGTYTLQCSKLINQTGYTILLEDKLNNVFLPVDTALAYVITANTSDNIDRFVLRFRTGLTVGSLGTSKSILLSTYNNDLMLTSNGVAAEGAELKVYDASGKVVQIITNQSIAPGFKIIPLENLSAGVYLVSFILDGVSYTGKVVLK